MDIRITQVLTHGESVIKLVREAVADHLLTARHLIIRFAFVEVRRQLVRLTVGVVIRHHCPFTRQPAVIPGIGIALEITQESEVRFVIRTPAKGGRDRIAGRFRHLLLGILAATQTGQAIRPHPVIINGIAEIKPRLPQIIGTHFKLDFFQRLSGRSLADHADDTARVAVAVQHRRWPTHHFNTFKEVIPLQLHPIQILVGVHRRRRGEAANRHYVIGG